MVALDRFSRQSFLGPRSQERIETSVVGVIGLGGGGSHIVQQLAHIGFKNFVIYDFDTVEDSNLNRLVGATTVDALAESPKLLVARRMIYGLQSDANVEAISHRWQNNPESLRTCHLVFGCLDSFKERHELEVVCRRYLINYIDIGMDVHGESQPYITGQVVLSSPGGPCMRCLGFITEDVLSREAARYGKAGSRPQVVWSNGVLASTAVGIGVDLICDWTKERKGYEYLVFDGNLGTLQPSITLDNPNLNHCPHYGSESIGAPVYKDL